MTAVAATPVTGRRHRRLAPAVAVCAAITAFAFLSLGSPLFPAAFGAAIGLLLALSVSELSERHGEVGLIATLVLLFGQNVLLGIAFNTTSDAPDGFALALIEAKTIFAVALFVLTCARVPLAGLSLPQRLLARRLPPAGTWWFFAFGGLLLVWTLLQALVPGPPALSRFGYLRNFTSPLVYGAVGYRFFRSSRWELDRFWRTLLTGLAVFGFAATAAQALWPAAWAQLMSVEEVSAVKGPISQHASVFGGHLVVRRGGLLGEGVNAAYCFGAVALALWQLRRPAPALLAATVAGFALGKGGIGATVVAVVLVVAGRRWLPRRADRWKPLAAAGVALAAALALATPALTSYGEAGLFGVRSSSEIHIKGAVSGLTAAARQPLGHGLGAGGNFSHIASGLTLDRREWIATGSESAMGVIGYQLGILGILLMLATMVALVAALFAVVHRERDTPTGRLALGTAALVASLTGLLFFQENSLSPQATAIVFVLAGTILGAAERDHRDRPDVER